LPSRRNPLPISHLQLSSSRTAQKSLVKSQITELQQNKSDKNEI
jgi:hypothetical protein